MKEVYKELTEEKILERINFADTNIKLAGYTKPESMLQRIIHTAEKEDLPEQKFYIQKRRLL